VLAIPLRRWTRRYLSQRDKFHRVAIEGRGVFGCII
jgi:hypothetical protein